MFRSVTVGLLNAHRFPFLLLLTLRILQSEGHATDEEVRYLLSGQVGSSVNQPGNPARDDVDWTADDGGFDRDDASVGLGDDDEHSDGDGDDDDGVSRGSDRADLAGGAAGALWMSDQAWSNLVGLSSIDSLS